MGIHFAFTPIVIAASLTVISAANSQSRRYFPPVVIAVIAAWAVIQTAWQSVPSGNGLSHGLLIATKGFIAVAVVFLLIGGVSALLQLANSNIFSLRVKPTTLAVRLFALLLIVATYVTVGHI